MKTTLKGALIAAVLCLTLAAPATAAEEASKGMTFGIVDINKVLQAAEAAKGILGELEGKRKEFQTQITKEEDSLRAFETSVMKEKEKLSKEDFEKKRKEFEEKMVTAQKMVQDKKRLLDQAFGDSMGKLRTEALKVSAEISKERGFDAVFTQDALVLAEKDLDITDEVLERVNKNIKKIPVVWAAKK